MRWLLEDAHGGDIPPNNPFLKESAAPVKMHSCFLDLSLDCRRVPLGLVEILDVGESRAHWRSNPQQGLLLVHDLFSLRPSGWVVEVPRLALGVSRGEVERDSRNNSQSGFPRCCRRDPGCGVYFRDYRSESVGRFSSDFPTAVA